LGFFTTCRGIHGEERQGGSSAAGGGRGSRRRGRAGAAKKEKWNCRPHSRPGHDDRRFREPAENSQAFLAPTPKTTDETALASVQTQAANLPPAKAAFFDIPDIIVNIQTPDSAPAFLKLSVSLELDKAEAKAAIEPVLPRIIDQFQTYLRELRVEDIRGSAGVMRLKEELLRRVNLAVAPTPVRDVLLKEMIVQ
jgi:flagellar basal body-associated protein FliL